MCHSILIEIEVAETSIEKILESARHNLIRRTRVLMDLEMSLKTTGEILILKI